MLARPADMPCIVKLEPHAEVIKQAAKEGNGQMLWDGASQCAEDGIKHPDFQTRDFNDISAGCTLDDYSWIARGLINCNQFPE